MTLSSNHDDIKYGNMAASRYLGIVRPIRSMDQLFVVRVFSKTTSRPIEWATSCLSKAVRSFRSSARPEDDLANAEGESFNPIAASGRLALGRVLDLEVLRQ